MTKSNLPGPKAHAMIERDHKVISPSYPRGYPFVMDHGKGSEVWDVDGNRFLDFMGGIAVVSTGYSHPKVVKASFGDNSNGDRRAHTVLAFLHLQVV